MRTRLFALLCLAWIACAPEGGTPGTSSSGLRILPREAFADQTLHASDLRHAASLDALPAAQEPLPTSLRWLINGHVVGNGDTLPAQGFHRGDVIELQRVHSAGGLVQVLERDQVVIRNSPPQVTAVGLARSRENGIYLQCAVSSSDVDDDPLRLRYEWSVDGQPLIGALDELASLRDVGKGSRVRVRVFASDGQLESEAFESDPYLVDNLPPRLQLSPDLEFRAAKNGRRTVLLALAVDDPDGDPVEIELEGAPADARYDATHGTVSWTVRGAMPALRLLVRARDAKGASVEQTLRLPGESVASR